MATSAFQIEGASRADGKGESIWDRFHADGKTPVGPDPACDHYHRLEEDLDLLAYLGVDAYRFSIAWTRVLPEGTGDVNAAGLGFYDRLVDGLVERGIEPWPTLYHWDLPQDLQESGGWVSRDIVHQFENYARVVSARLGDRVKNWITINEPWVAAFLGHLYGVFAPGLTDWNSALRAGHHLLVGHGLAVSAIKGEVSEAAVGPGIDCRPARPASDDPADAGASVVFDGFRNRWFFDPLHGRGYPEDIMRRYSDLGRLDAGEMIEVGDMEVIATANDFLGLNYYTTLPVSAGSEELDDPEVDPGPDPSDGYTEMGWAIDPGGLRDYLVDLHEEYSPASLVVTENGASFSDGPNDDGVVHDQRRIDYLAAHVRAVVDARAAGAPVDGYFVWSLMDNIEWTQGYDQKFGLIWVDRDTLERTPKASFDWYRSEIERLRG